MTAAIPILVRAVKIHTLKKKQSTFLEGCKIIPCYELVGDEGLTWQLTFLL
jgi:hypothetical protein